MELISQALLLGAVGMVLLVIRAHVQTRYVTAIKLCVGGLCCELATIVVDFVRNAYTYPVAQGVMLVFFTIYLMWKREYDTWQA